jgi:hypothetical protein
MRLSAAKKSTFVDEDGVPELDGARLHECPDPENVLLHVEPAHDREFLPQNVTSAMVRLVFEFGRKLDTSACVQNR